MKDEINEESLNNSLYVAISKLYRIIIKMAKEEFKMIGLSPSHAFTLMLINSDEGISQKLSKKLNLDPSTITRSIDELEQKNLVYRMNEGKISNIFPTEEGQNLN